MEIKQHSLKYQQVKEETTRETKKCRQMKTKRQYCQNICNAVQAELKGKVIAVNTYINKENYVKSITYLFTLRN